MSACGRIADVFLPDRRWVCCNKGGIGRIAHNVILASVSVPSAFPPVCVEVTTDGRAFSELHVDGGATTRICFVPSDIDGKLLAEALKVKGKLDVNLIRNSRISSK